MSTQPSADEFNIQWGTNVRPTAAGLADPPNFVGKVTLLGIRVHKTQKSTGFMVKLRIEEPSEVAGKKTVGWMWEVYITLPDGKKADQDEWRASDLKAIAVCFTAPEKQAEIRQKITDTLSGQRPFKWSQLFNRTGYVKYEQAVDKDSFPATTWLIASEYEEFKKGDRQLADKAKTTVKKPDLTTGGGGFKSTGTGTGLSLDDDHGTANSGAGAGTGNNGAGTAGGGGTDGGLLDLL